MFVTKVHLAEKAKFQKHIGVFNSLLKFILHKFFDVWMRNIYTDSGNAVIDTGLSVYFSSYLGILVFSNHFWTVEGHAVAQLVEALRYKSEGRGFDSPMLSWNFSLT